MNSKYLVKECNVFGFHCKFYFEHNSTVAPPSDILLKMMFSYLSTFILNKRERVSKTFRNNLILEPSPELKVQNNSL